MTKPPLRNALIHSACDGTGWLLVGPDINARKANIDAHRTSRINMRSSSFSASATAVWGSDARVYSGTFGSHIFPAFCGAYRNRAGGKWPALVNVRLGE